MKKHNVIEFILVGLLVCTAISCKLFSSANTAANGNTSLPNSANSNTIAVEQPLPTPATDCPSKTFTPGDSVNKEILKYEGCAVTMSGKLIFLKHPNLVLVTGYEGDSVLKGDYGYQGKGLDCFGDFSGDTYYQIQEKLASLRQNGQFTRLPTVTVKGTVKTTRSTYDGRVQTLVRECVITNFEK